MKSGNLKHIWIYLAIPAVMLLYYNQSANWHYHMTATGHIVEHAHPFSSSSGSSGPFQNHDHSDAEMAFFTQMMQMTGLLVFVLFGLSVLLSGYSLLLPQFFPRLIGIQCPGSILTRGPPRCF